MTTFDIIMLILFLISVAAAIPAYFYTHPRSGPKK